MGTGAATGRDTSRKQGTASLGTACPSCQESCCAFILTSSPASAGAQAEVRGAREFLQERLAGQGDLPDGARPGSVEMLLSLSGLDLYVDKFKNDKGRKTRNPVRELMAGKALQEMCRAG